jgi:hypothetical protein
MLHIGFFCFEFNAKWQLSGTCTPPVTGVLLEQQSVILVHGLRCQPASQPASQLSMLTAASQPASLQRSPHFLTLYAAGMAAGTGCMTARGG